MTTRTAPTTREQAKATNTVRLHRVFKAPAERIYKAVLDPAANCKWLAPYGFTCTVLHLEPKVGGTYKMSFTNFSSGNSHSFGGKYLELIPGERIVATDVFDDPGMPGEMRTRFRASATPFYGFGNEDIAYPEKGLLPSLGISLGYVF